MRQDDRRRLVQASTSLPTQANQRPKTPAKEGTDFEFEVQETPVQKPPRSRRYRERGDHTQLLEAMACVSLPILGLFFSCCGSCFILEAVFSRKEIDPRDKSKVAKEDRSAGRGGRSKDRAEQKNPDDQKANADKDGRPEKRSGLFTSLDGKGENSIRMKFVRIPKGTFTMGSMNTDVRDPPEPCHEVELTNDFYLGAYEVTLKQYRTIANLGDIGGTAFTPIVNGPEVAILGPSRGRFEPVWRDGASVPRLMLPSSLSFDHREGRVRG